MHSTDCENCGKKLATRRFGRARRFCSSKCRQAAFRYAQFEKNFAPINGLGALRNASKTTTISNDCKAENGDRAFGVAPRNILGGYRWPSPTAIKPTKLQAIIAAEIGGDLISPPIWVDWPADADGAAP
jgi:hypothetical protein